MNLFQFGNPLAWLPVLLRHGPSAIMPMMGMGFIQFLPAIIKGVSMVAGAVAGKQKAPKTAAYTPVDLQAEQKKAIAGNLENADSIEQLLARSNAFTQDQATSLMEKAVPGWSKLSERMMGLADEAASNPYGLPADVENNIMRLAAERGVSTGVRGQAGEFSALRDLGVNSLQYGNARISQAQQLLSTVAGLAPRVNPASPLSFYITPAQQAEITSRNNEGERSVQQATNNANAAASNYNRSMWGNVISNLGGQVAGMVGGKSSILDQSGGGTSVPAWRTPSYNPQSLSFGG